MSDKISTAAAYAASGATVGFGLTANEIAAFVGAGVAVLTFFVNLWFKHRHLQLAISRAEADDDS